MTATEDYDALIAKAKFIRAKGDRRALITAVYALANTVSAALQAFYMLRQINNPAAFRSDYPAEFLKSARMDPGTLYARIDAIWRIRPWEYPVLAASVILAAVLWFYVARLVRTGERLDDILRRA